MANALNTLGSTPGVLSSAQQADYFKTNSTAANPISPAQYLAQHATPATAVKSITTPDGTVSTYHAPDAGALSSASSNTPHVLSQAELNAISQNNQQSTPSPTYTGFIGNNTSTANTPVGKTTAGQIQPVANSGQQTSNEQQTQSGLIGQSQNANPIAQTAGTNLNNLGLGNQESPQLTKARQDLLNFQNEVAKQTSDINQSGTWTSRAEGEQGQANIQNANTLANLQGAVNNALTSQGQQITASTAAGGIGNSAQGLMIGAGNNAYSGAQNQAQRQTGANEAVLNAVAPQFPSYSSQVVQPGMLGANGSTNGTLDSAVAGVVQKLKDGTMSYNDATNALAGYGQGGINALQKALPQGFNVAQSNTLAGQQGTIGVNYQLADKALTNVEDRLKELGSMQKTNQPWVNGIANWVSTTFGAGSEQTRAMTGAVQSLRNAYGSLLASVKGGTPSDYSNQASAEIPNEPTPNDIAAIRKNFETLGQARKDILGNPGQAGNSSGSTGSGLYSF